jgi:hypothetical protein
MAFEPCQLYLEIGRIKTGIGFIAQEVEQVIPELVNTNADGTKGLYSLEMIPFLVKALQEQQMLIEKLQSENAKLSSIKSDVEALKKMMLKEQALNVQ